MSCHCYRKNCNVKTERDSTIVSWLVVATTRFMPVARFHLRFIQTVGSTAPGSDVSTCNNPLSKYKCVSDTISNSSLLSDINCSKSHLYYHCSESTH